MWGMWGKWRKFKKHKQCAPFFFSIGFAVEQGLTESIVGILRGVGAVFGVTGTLIYPWLRKRFGLKITGVITFITDLSLLTPCLVSVFVAGSPFVPDYYINPEKYAQPVISVTVSISKIFTSALKHS